MEESKKLRKALDELYLKAEKVVNAIIDECGTDGRLGLPERVMPYEIPKVVFYNADGDLQQLYLSDVIRDDGDVIFVFEDDTYCSTTDIVAQSLIKTVEELCLSWGLSPSLIEDDVLG